MLQTFSRSQLDTAAWDACVAASSQGSVYGYSWYLDAVLPAPEWAWVGIVWIDESGGYRAVMPVPLRRKRVAGILYGWVVHQPFFCSFLSVISPDKAVETALFFQQMVARFRYGSVFSTQCQSHQEPALFSHQLHNTHTLNLAVGYEAIYQNYTRDRRLNLRRAERALGPGTGWTIIHSTDVWPLLSLFRSYHADSIDGGVTNRVYALFQTLAGVLQKRGLLDLRYALYEGRVEAGTLFVCGEGRITYLFNAASPLGRKANARTLLIDQLIREKAGKPIVFDFESPAKSTIRDFYASFGATEEPYWNLRWNRLSKFENRLLAGWRYVRKRVR